MRTRTWSPSRKLKCSELRTGTASSSACRWATFSLQGRKRELRTSQQPALELRLKISLYYLEQPSGKGACKRNGSLCLVLFEARQHSCMAERTLSSCKAFLADARSWAKLGLPYEQKACATHCRFGESAWAILRTFEPWCVAEHYLKRPHILP